MDEENVHYGDKKERSAKQGRRARRADSGLDIDQSLDVTNEEMSSARPSRDSDAPPRPSRRKGGWGEEKRRTMEELDDLDKTIEDGERMADFERRRPSTMEDDGMFFETTRKFTDDDDDDGDTAVKSAFGLDGDDDEDPFGDRLKTSNARDESDEEPDIPVIPELEDNQEEDLTQQIAMAPNVVVNRVATYRELDNDLVKHSGLLTLDNEIDLKLLAKGLSAEQDILEEDTPWDWERLFTEVTSELLTEWEKMEVKEADEPIVA